ncbi:unnamed protein product, partial [Timema podura]|nr:unnamed protein product [Timema podura]
MSPHVLSAATNTRLAVPTMFQACWYTSLSELPVCLLPFLLGHHHARWMTGSLAAATASLAATALMRTTVSTAVPLVVSALARLMLTCSLCAGLHLTYSLRDTRLGLMNVAVTESLAGLATSVAPVLNYMVRAI